jgi:hypothetical protein
VRALARELRQDLLAAPVAKQVVVLVKTDRRPEDRVVANQPNEPFLDEVVEPIVEGAAVRRRGWTREWSRGARFGHAVRSSGRAGLGAGCVFGPWAVAPEVRRLRRAGRA